MFVGLDTKPILGPHLFVEVTKVHVKNELHEINDSTLGLNHKG